MVHLVKNSNAGLFQQKVVVVATKITVSSETMAKVVAFVQEFTNREGRGCPIGALEYVGGFSKVEVKATQTAGLIESGKGSEGGFFLAGTKPDAKGPQVKATVKNQLAAFVSTIGAMNEGDTLSRDMIDTALSLVREYEAQNAKRRKTDSAE